MSISTGIPLKGWALYGLQLLHHGCGHAVEVVGHAL